MPLNSCCHGRRVRVVDRRPRTSARAVSRAGCDITTRTPRGCFARIVLEMTGKQLCVDIYTETEFRKVY